MFVGIERIEGKVFNLNWGYGVEWKYVIFTFKTIPVIIIYLIKGFVIKSHTAYVILIGTCVTGNRFTSSEDYLAYCAFVCGAVTAKPFKGIIN